ncbi:hypothetical protein [Microlunatus parietis]|uniref:Uncharacterized protein n=1 Tax=Microlunatus parietis TaxID=682979 RepID=A0A7Y9IEM9_9ACTN|nr:hypothetical protein [Microlunatus parietis]NYE75462.1 hypothetical protein [Microlunatus parietis]
MIMVDQHRFLRFAVAAVVINLGYALVHLAWLIMGEPAWAHGVSVFPGGWVPVLPAVIAVASIMIMILVPRAWRPAAVAAAAAGAALLAYSMLAWIGLLMLLMIPFGLPMPADDLARLVVRVAGAAGGGLTLLAAVARARASRPACPRCGGRHPDLRTRPPGWAVAGGWLAVAGFAARFAVELPDILTAGVSGPGGLGFQLFVALLVLAGTVLPLALIRPWGRAWPRWVPGLAGRRIPRLLVLVPGLVMAAGLLAYFGIGGIGALLTGHDSADPAAWLMIGGYTLWGLGLLLAAAGYARLTDSVAAGCVPVRAAVVPNRQNAGRGEPRPRSDRSKDHEQPHGPQAPSTAG